MESLRTKKGSLKVMRRYIVFRDLEIWKTASSRFCNGYIFLAFADQICFFEGEALKLLNILKFRLNQV